MFESQRLLSARVNFEFIKKFDMNRLPNEILTKIFILVPLPYSLSITCKQLSLCWKLESTQAYWFITQAITYPDFAKNIQMDRERGKTIANKYWLFRKTNDELIANILYRNQIGIFYDIRDIAGYFDYSEVEYFASVGSLAAVKILLKPFQHKHPYSDIVRPPNRIKNGEDCHWLYYFLDNCNFDVTIDGFEHDYFQKGVSGYKLKRHYGFPWQALYGVLKNYTIDKYDLIIWLLSVFSAQQLKLKADSDLDTITHECPLQHLYRSEASPKDMFEVFQLLIPFVDICMADLNYVACHILQDTNLEWIPILKLLVSAAANVDQNSIDILLTNINDSIGTILVRK
jgi:hypothetical protein